MTLWDMAEAERRREEGMARAANARGELLAVAQEAAYLLALHTDTGEVDSDMVALHMERRGLDYAALGNAAGSVFRNAPEGRAWVWTGKVRRSERASTHARMIRVWRLERR